jgi:iron(III) transport system ATP-binding protein
MGNESLIEYRLDHDGSVMKATVPNVFLPQAGTVMWLTVRRDRCFVFGSEG